MTAATQRLELVPLARLIESPSNHRKKTWGDMKELAESVREKGVLQPILARPAKGIGNNLLEIVFGHRRFRAAQAAGLDAIPAVVRELTDVEALEANIIENASRADVHPLEEAEGIEQLLEQKDKPYTVEEIARKLGKSLSHVYQRLKLLALCPEARKAFYEGQLTTSTALMFARIPSKELQKKALKELHVDDADDPPRSSWISQELQRRFMLKLTDAPFQPDDADLVKAAGACTACPKRTGAQPALFEDVGSADVCTDTICYQEKVQAAWQARSAAAKAAGQKVLSEAEAKKVFASYGGTTYNADYVALDETCHEDPKQRTYKALLGKAASTEVVLGKDHSGSPRDLVPKGALKKLLKAAGHSFTTRPSTSSASKEAKEANRKAKEKAELERKVRARCATLVSLALDAKKPGRDLWGMALDTATGLAYGESPAMERRFGEDWPAKLPKALAGMTTEQIQAVLLDFLLGQVFDRYGAGCAKDEKALLAWAGVEEKAVRAELVAAAKAAEPAKGKKVAKPAAAARDLPRATAEELGAEECLDCGKPAGAPSPGCLECQHGRPLDEDELDDLVGTREDAVKRHKAAGKAVGA